MSGFFNDNRREYRRAFSVVMTSHVSHHHHMHIRWHNLLDSNPSCPMKHLRFHERASIVGHVGMMLLSYGTGAWRVRQSMNAIARVLNLTCSADIGLVSLDYTCIDDEGHSYTQALSLATTGVNTSKLHQMELFVDRFVAHADTYTLGEFIEQLDEVEHLPLNYSALQAALASGLACAGFIFLLGAGIYEMICCFFGAAVGNYVRRTLIDHKITLIGQVAGGVAPACVVYVLVHTLLMMVLHPAGPHLEGYIGALLFVIPGFPFITAGLDLAKLDMRSGIERLVYALIIIVVATVVGWTCALALNLQPHDLIPLAGLTPLTLTILRLITSWCGVFGFSIMFNTECKMAMLTAVIGAVANTIRLSLVSWTLVPACIAAFIGALIAGMMASLVRKRIGFPRIALTVPSIVIMVPGLYMYRAMYSFGSLNIPTGSHWFLESLLIVLALPLGLIVARIISDPEWRKFS